MSLLDRLLGPRCPLCGERAYPADMAVHNDREHAGDVWEVSMADAWDAGRLAGVLDACATHGPTDPYSRLAWVALVDAREPNPFDASRNRP